MRPKESTYFNSKYTSRNSYEKNSSTDSNILRRLESKAVGASRPSRDANAGRGTGRVGCRGRYDARYNSQNAGRELNNLWFTADEDRRREGRRHIPLEYTIIIYFVHITIFYYILKLSN